MLECFLKLSKHTITYCKIFCNHSSMNLDNLYSPNCKQLNVFTDKCSSPVSSTFSLPSWTSLSIYTQFFTSCHAHNNDIFNICRIYWSVSSNFMTNKFDVGSCSIKTSRSIPAIQSVHKSIHLARPWPTFPEDTWGFPLDIAPL